MLGWVLFVFGLTAGFSAIGAQNVQLETRDNSADSDTVMCELAQSYLRQLQVECNSKFQHYQSKKFRIEKSTSAIRIGHWNLFNLGIDKQRFKDLSLLVELIQSQKWDVFAATEMFRLPGFIFEENLRLAKEIEKLLLISQKTGAVQQAVTYIQWQGALRLLLALQEADPSWSLVLAPKSLGSDGASALETGGVFYRASRVKPISSDFCSAIGCSTVLPEELFPGVAADNLSEIVSREPFMVSFANHSGTFDFTILPFHARFRHPKRAGVLEAIAGGRRDSSGNLSFGTGPFFDLDSVLGAQRADEFRKSLVEGDQPVLVMDAAQKIELEEKGAIKEQLARYAELNAMGRFLAYLKSKYREQDIIWAGDFNLEYDLDPLKETVFEKRLRDIWDIVLLKNPKGWQGASVWGLEPSSLSDKERLASNYDHFIVDTQATSECLAPSVTVVDFTRKNVVPQMERYTAFLNQEAYRRIYQTDAPVSVNELIRIARRSPESFDSLTLQQRLGLSFLDARQLGDLEIKDPAQFEIRKVQLEDLMVDLQRRAREAFLTTSVGKAESEKLRKRISEYAVSLQNQWGVFDDTIEGEVIRSLQPKYPRTDALISPERLRRAQEYDKIIGDYGRRIIESQWAVDPISAKDVRYQVFRELISDHLPIQMDCASSKRDDD